MEVTNYLFSWDDLPSGGGKHWWFLRFFVGWLATSTRNRQVTFLGPSVSKDQKDLTRLGGGGRLMAVGMQEWFNGCGDLGKCFGA